MALLPFRPRAESGVSRPGAMRPYHRAGPQDAGALRTAGDDFPRGRDAVPGGDARRPARCIPWVVEPHDADRREGRARSRRGQSSCVVRGLSLGIPGARRFALGPADGRGGMERRVRAGVGGSRRRDLSRLALSTSEEHRVRLMLALALLAVGASAGAQQRAFHVVDYDLALTLPDTGKRIEGLATLTVVRLGAADTLVLDLTEPKVSRVWQGEKPVGFSQDAEHVRIPVGGVRGDTLKVRLEDAARVTDGLTLGTASAGRWVAFGDNWPNRARHWIPSLDHPSDKATVTWTVNAPSDRRVVANGKLGWVLGLPKD